MKPKKSKSKTKKTVEQENKKPPVIQTPQTEAKKSITEEDEKNMLLGQIHIESKETDQKNLWGKIQKGRKKISILNEWRKNETFRIN